MHEDDIAQREFVNDPARMKRQADWERRYLQRPLLMAALIVAFVLLTGCIPTSGPNYYNPGGSIIDHRKEYHRLLGTDEPIEILGACDSACTIFISHPNTCVGPNAVFGFHGAWPNTGDWDIDYRYDMEIGQYLPEPLYTSYVNEWRLIGPWRLHKIPVAEMLELVPTLKRCK